MSVELRPLGVKCNIECQYCYQNPQRDAGNVLHHYDFEKMKAGVEKAGGPFTLFGGEPLLLPKKDLEELLAWGLETYGQNGMQTNGTLIDEDHIRLFKRYKAHVGISVDGPGELNDVRWAETLQRTRAATARTHAAIERLCQEGMPPSLIVTLHRGNATNDKLPLMHDWIHYLEGLGVTSVRLHDLEVETESISRKYRLSPPEILEAFLSFARLEQELTTLRLDMFTDMRKMLRGQDNKTTCIWNACDPYTTRAVQGIEGNGQRSNCGRTNKDGIDFTKADQEGFERYIALYHTPQEYGGCKGCRFFLMCKGNCPGTSLEGDWRNRTASCDLWKGLYRHLEEHMLEEGITPISASPDRKRVEQFVLDSWATGRNTSIAAGLVHLASQPKGTAKPQATPHSDAHGDHTDYGHRLSTPALVEDGSPHMVRNSQ